MSLSLQFPWFTSPDYTLTRGVAECCVCERSGQVHAKKDEVLEVFQMKRSFDRVAMIRIGNNGKLVFGD